MLSAGSGRTPSSRAAVTTCFAATVRQQLGEPGLEQPIQRLRGDLLEHEDVDVLAATSAHHRGRVTTPELEVRRHHGQVGLRSSPPPTNSGTSTQACTARPSAGDHSAGDQPPGCVARGEARTGRRPGRAGTRSRRTTRTRPSARATAARCARTASRSGPSGPPARARGRRRRPSACRLVAPAQAGCSYAASSPASDSLTRAVSRVPSAVCSTERTSPFSWTRLTRSPRS